MADYQPLVQGKRKCSVDTCLFTFSTYAELIGHLSSLHEVEVEMDIRSFDNEAGILVF